MNGQTDKPVYWEAAPPKIKFFKEHSDSSDTKNEKTGDNNKYKTSDYYHIKTEYLIMMQPNACLLNGARFEV